VDQPSVSFEPQEEPEHIDVDDTPHATESVTKPSEDVETPSESEPVLSQSLLIQTTRSRLVMLL
jgi:hypothetical protein